MDLKKIAAAIIALTVIIGTAYTIDGRWVRSAVFAEGMSEVKTRQYRFEERGIQKDINDLEDRLESPQLPEKRRGGDQEPLRALKRGLPGIRSEKAATQMKGGGK